MWMPMLLERSVSTCLDLEISCLHIEFPLIVRFAKQTVAAYPFEIGRVRFVLLSFDTIPVVIGAVNNF
jgi:hypothetical protein